MKLQQLYEAGYTSAKGLSARQVIEKFFIPFNINEVDDGGRWQIEDIFDEDEDLSQIQIFRPRENLQVTSIRPNVVEVEFVVYMKGEWFNLDLDEGITATDPSGFQVIETRVLHQP